MPPAYESVSRRVRAFYDDVPFSYFETAGSAADSVRGRTLATSHPDLHALLSSGAVRTVLEFGCGSGWLTTLIAAEYGASVTAVDFCERAVQRATAVAETLGVTARTQFVVADLFEYEHEEAVDLVVSEGVLHHTHSARAAFDRIQGHVLPGGHLHVGLYHRHGREPFLTHLQGILDRDGEDAAFRAYRELDATRRGDDAHLRSWFRDQVLHPHETQHSLREVSGWLAAAHFVVESTSVNAFDEFEDLADVFDIEPHYADLSREANITEGRYFPGYFTVLARNAASIA